jgi:hypothetical protein
LQRASTTIYETGVNFRLTNEKAQSNLLHVSRDEFVHDTSGDCNAGEHGRQRKGKSPGSNVGKDETAEESTQEGDDEGDFF